MLDRQKIKGTKTSSGTREIMLQPQAKEALTNQYAYTGKISEIVFHDSRNNQSWKNDQTIRKVVWIPQEKR